MIKLRFFLLALICVTLQGVLEAKTKPIETDVRGWKSLERTILDFPILSHDRNQVYIYCHLPLQNLEVTVTDALGYVVYKEILNIEANQSISFTFDDKEHGEYIIDLSHGMKYLYGWFELE